MLINGQVIPIRYQNEPYKSKYFSAYRIKIFDASPITIGVDTEEIFYEDKGGKDKILRLILVAIRV